MVPHQGAPPGPLGAPCSQAVGLAAGLSKEIHVAQSHRTCGCAPGDLVTATPQRHHTAPKGPPPSRGAGRRVAVGTPPRALPPAAPCSSPRSAGGGGVVLGAVVCATRITSAHTGRDLHGNCASLCWPRARSARMRRNDRGTRRGVSARWCEPAIEVLPGLAQNFSFGSGRPPIWGQDGFVRRKKKINTAPPDLHSPGRCQLDSLTRAILVFS